jgi:glycosyltransferase involved in cell wall biosynthesis
LLRLRKRLVYSMATHIFANSEAAREDVQSVFGVPKRKCRVFHNAIADPLACKELVNTPRAEKRLVCVGRLFPTKGQDILIRAVALAKDRLPGLSVEFVGDGPFRGVYMQLAHDLGTDENCTFVGSVPREQVLARMAAGTVTVVPSRSEAFGWVNIESLSVGTPVLASNVGGIVEIIRDGVDGFLVPPEDPGALAERLLTMLGDPDLRQTMSRNARERFLAQFELSKMARNQAAWLEDIMEPNGQVAVHH